MNKADLADPSVTKQWQDYFKEEGHTAFPVDAATGTGVKEIPGQLKLLLKEKIDRQIAKGMNPRAIRALIVGIPNVGKSTLINRLAGRSIAATGDRPGVTKGQQWIKVGGEIELLDTPGILWPKFEDENVGYRLAVTGAIKEEILNVEDVAFLRSNTWSSITGTPSVSASRSTRTCRITRTKATKSSLSWKRWGVSAAA